VINFLLTSTAINSSSFRPKHALFGEAADNSKQQQISADNQVEAKGYFPAAPVAESQSLTVLPKVADATSLPSGENATAMT
jgi:hypothetical protein